MKGLYRSYQMQGGRKTNFDPHRNNAMFRGKYFDQCRYGLLLYQIQNIVGTEQIVGLLCTIKC